MTDFSEEALYIVRDGCDSLGLWPVWVFDVLALESGLDPLRMQANATIIKPTSQADRRPMIKGREPNVLSAGTGARGLWQKMPTVIERWPVKLLKADGTPDPAAGMPKLIALYAPSDPVQQLKDAFAFWAQQKKDFWGPDNLPSREHFYCLNLAPARVKSEYLYKRPDDPAKLHGSAWYANRNLDPQGTGFIKVEMLKPVLDNTHKGYEARIEREVDRVANLNPYGGEGI